MHFFRSFFMVLMSLAAARAATLAFYTGSTECGTCPDFENKASNGVCVNWQNRSFVMVCQLNGGGPLNLTVFDGPDCQGEQLFYADAGGCHSIGLESLDLSLYAQCEPSTPDQVRVHCPKPLALSIIILIAILSSALVATFLWLFYLRLKRRRAKESTNEYKELPV